MRTLTLPRPFMPALAFAAFALVLGAASEARAHCQVPCGIYDDMARVEAMLEDVHTIEKAVKNISDLAGKKDAQSLNQAVRWINNKEIHATKIITTISEYFLTQKIKLPKGKSKKDLEAYHAKLAAHHLVMVRAMKAKQSVDPKKVEALHQAVDALKKFWKK